MQVLNWGKNGLCPLINWDDEASRRFHRTPNWVATVKNRFVCRGCFRRRRDDIVVNKLSIVGQKCENLALTGVMPWKTLLLTVRALGRGELSTDRVRGESIDYRKHLVGLAVEE